MIVVVTENLKKMEIKEICTLKDDLQEER